MMNIEPTKRHILQTAASKPPHQVHSKIHNGERYVEIAGQAFRQDFRQRKMYLFALYDLIKTGYLDEILPNVFELAYPGIFACENEQWDVNLDLSRGR
jgi:hypothetical protein